MSTMRYVRLKRGNDWGSEYFERHGTIRPCELAAVETETAKES